MTGEGIIAFLKRETDMIKMWPVATRFPHSISLQGNMAACTEPNKHGLMILLFTIFMRAIIRANLSPDYQNCPT
jgi:hypothetical protein